MQQGQEGILHARIGSDRGAQVADGTGNHVTAGIARPSCIFFVICVRKNNVPKAIFRAQGDVLHASVREVSLYARKIVWQVSIFWTNNKIVYYESSAKSFASHSFIVIPQEKKSRAYEVCVWQ